MIIKLNADSSITIKPQAVPEGMDAVYLSYIFPKGTNTLHPVLNWGGEVFEGANKFIKKVGYRFDMTVSLYSEGVLIRSYTHKEPPRVYIGYNIEKIQPDIITRMKELELQVVQLEERGDII